MENHELRHQAPSLHEWVVKLSGRFLEPIRPLLAV
jgi:hypothetical protein